MDQFTASRNGDRLPRLGLVAAAIALLGTAGCNSSSSPVVGQNTPGTVETDPDTGRSFFVDPSKGGLGSEVRIARSAWGRLVDVYAFDATGARVLMQEDYLISATLISDGLDYLLESNPVTAQQTLTILRNVDDTLQGGGRDQFFQKLNQTENGLIPVFDKGSSGAGFFTMVPRNATLMIQFDDLIDASTLDDSTMRLLTGTPSVLPYESRMMVDSNHGDLADFDGKGGSEFYSTRVLVDMTVSEVESFETDPPLPVNAVGLPASVNSNLSNVLIRIPTETNPQIGQDHLLENPSGHFVTTVNNGSVDFGSSTLDVVRSFRAGGPSNTTSDPFEGFLPDSTPPRVVGVQELGINVAPISTNAPPIGDGTEFLLPQLTFNSVFCSQTPAVGDILSQPGVFAEVIEPPTSIVGGVVTDLKVRLLVWPNAWDEPGQDGPLEWETTGGGTAQFLSPYDPDEDGGREACFVTVLPNPTGFPNQPTTGIFPSSSMSVRFSEPMAADVMSAFEAMRLTRVEEPTASWEYIVGTIQQSLDLQEFAFVPDLPLTHELGQQESFFMTLVDGVSGPSDLAGNLLADPLPTVETTVEQTAPSASNGGRVWRYSSVDEEWPIGTPVTGPRPEWAGQIVFDTQRQLIRPRPVTRFEGLVDRNTQTIVGAMIGTPTGVQSPLSNFGSKTQILWRYLEMGYALQDETYYNIDVEGLNWSPRGGAVVVDTFDRFEMRMNHSFYQPDEVLVGIPPVPAYPNSGLVSIFENNFLSATSDPQKIVHKDFQGYSINPGDVFTTGQDLKMLPFPMNQTTSPDNFTYFTWRDTSIPDRAGPDSWGSEPARWWQVNGLPVPITGDCLGMMVPPTPNPFYGPGLLQTVALPLLMEFRCWQDSGAVGINRFDTSIAINVSTKPYFRAFSTGGINTSNENVFIDPSLETVANGGFDSASLPTSGAPTFGLDNEVYMGSADFVIRVSRSFSIWFGASDPTKDVNDEEPPNNFPNPKYFPATIEPPLQSQPLGTDIRVSYRGATSVVNGSAGDELNNAIEYELYGDHYLESISPCDGSINHNPPEQNTGVGFFNGNSNWFNNPSDINGAVFFQIRLTFFANPQTGLAPEVSAFAMTWNE